MGHAVFEAAAALRELVADFDPGELTPATCFRLANELARTEKACAAARVLAAARATQAGIPEEAGFKDGADWIAHHTGTTSGRARDSLQTAAQLGTCPDTRAALQSGEISLDQATEIIRTEADCPGAEATLLGVARGSDLGELRQKAREHIRKGVPAEELRQRQFTARMLKFWQDRDGMVRLHGALPAEWGVPLRNRIELAAQRLRRAVKEAGGTMERFEAYSADALVAILAASGASGAPASKSHGPAASTPAVDSYHPDRPERSAGTAPKQPAGPRPTAPLDPVDQTAPQPDSVGPPPPSRPDRQPVTSPELPFAAIPVAPSPWPRRPKGFQAELVIVCDLMAWRRGRTLPGEPCHVIGGGPIPVPVAREWSDDAFVKAVLHDGTAIHTICHFGRNMPAVLRTALYLGPVPDFTGRVCRDCGQPFGLEIDHVDPVGHHGQTSYDNLQPLCWSCHRAKTERDRQAGLIGSRLAKGP